MTLGQEDPLEKRMATYSNIFCLGNPMDRGAWWAKSLGSQSQDIVTEYTCTYYKTLATCLKNDLAHKAVVRTEWVNTCKLLPIVSGTE